MKKLLALIVAVGIVVSFSSMAMADEENPVDNFIMDRIVKTGIAYDVIDRETKTIIGAILVEDFYLKNLDLDFFIDGDKSVMVGFDYMFRKGTDVQPFAGVGVGLDRIEKIDAADEWGEYFDTLNVGIRFKF